MDEERFYCVADGWARAFGVNGDVNCHVYVGAFVNVQMAIASSRFYYGDGGVFHDALYESLAATGNKDVNVAAHGHQSSCAFSVGIGNKLDAMRVKLARINSALGYSDNGFVGIYSFLTASENDGIARFYA